MSFFILGIMFVSCLIILVGVGTQDKSLSGFAVSENFSDLNISLTKSLWCAFTNPIELSKKSKEANCGVENYSGENDFCKCIIKE